MTRRLEVDPSVYYSKLFSQMRNTSSLNTEMMKVFLKIRNTCLNELSVMQQLTEELHPSPVFFTYDSLVYTHSNVYRYYCHSEPQTTLTNAIMTMFQRLHEKRFTADSNNNIVLADSNALIPVVAQFTPVINANETYELPKNHPSIVLYSLAHKVVLTIQQSGHDSKQFVKFMLAEGVNEQIDDISAIL